MAIDEAPVLVTMLAGADMSDAAAAAAQGQYHFVKQNTTAQTVVICSSQGEEVFGVMYDKPISGQAGAVAVSGVCKVMAGGAITIGNDVTVGADAQAEAAATGDAIAGKAMTTGADNQLMTILLRPSKTLAL